MQRPFTSFVKRFWNTTFAGATKNEQQSDKDFGQKGNRIIETGMSETGPQFSLLLAVVKDFFAQNNFGFLINHFAYTVYLNIESLKQD